MNTVYKSNVYPIKQGDNGITKSRSKKEILLDKLSKAIRLKHYSKATDRIYCGYVGEFIDFQMKQTQPEHGAKAIEEYLTHVMQKKSTVKSPLDRMLLPPGATR